MESRVLQYEPMLYQIAKAFGFGAKESAEFVELASLKISKRGSSFQRSDRIEMAKAVVHQCVYNISCVIFGQKELSTSFRGAGTLNYHLSAQLSTMPLSLRAVYILFHVGCSEEEIGYILNISTVQVKERVRKAAMKMWDFKV